MIFNGVKISPSKGASYTVVLYSNLLLNRVKWALIQVL